MFRYLSNDGATVRSSLEGSTMIMTSYCRTYLITSCGLVFRPCSFGHGRRVVASATWPVYPAACGNGKSATTAPVAPLAPPPGPPGAGLFIDRGPSHGQGDRDNRHENNRDGKQHDDDVLGLLRVEAVERGAEEDEPDEDAAHPQVQGHRHCRSNSPLVRCGRGLAVVLPSAAFLCRGCATFFFRRQPPRARLLSRQDTRQRVCSRMRGSHQVALPARRGQAPVGLQHVADDDHCHRDQ